MALRVVTPLLERISRWLEKSGVEATAWIVGFLVAQDAATRIPGVLGFLDGLG